MKPTRLEFEEGSSRKFWEAVASGPSLTVRFGRIGTNGQVKTKKLSSPSAAAAELAKLLESKLKKGYVQVGVAARPSVPALARKSKESPRLKPDAAVATAFMKWLERIASGLKAPKVVPDAVTYRKGVITLKLKGGRRVRGHISAPHSLLATLWRDDRKVLERVCLETPGQWNAVITLLRCEGPTHDRYLELVGAVHAAGDHDEARLAWLQAKFANDPDERVDPLFRALFPRLPKGASDPVFRSAAAVIERRLPLANDPSPVERFIVGTDVYDLLDDALLDVSGTGKREARFTQQLEAFIARLAMSDDLACRDLAKLIRLMFARTRALSPEQPS